MPHSAFYIVEEFLRSRDPQMRKNALTALAVLGRDEDTIERLTKLALNDADEGVRQRAVDEIVSLSDEVLPRAVKVLQTAMANASWRQTAYALLAHLKSLGRSLPKPGSFLSLPARLRLAWAMNKYTYPVRKWNFRFRTWKASLVGGTLCMAVVFLSFSFSKSIYWKNSAYGGVLFWVPLLSVTASAFVARHATPFNLYFDRAAAFTVEIGVAILYSMATEILLLLWYPIIESTPVGGEGLLALLFGLPFMIGFTRAATLLSYGVLKRRWLNIVFQVAVSTALMFLLLAAVNLIFWKIQPVVGEQQGDYFELKPLYQMLESLWLALLPVSVGVALSFAMIDNKSPLRLTRAGRLSKYFSYSIILLAAIMLILILFIGRRENSPRGVNINPTFDRLSGRVPSFNKPAAGVSGAPVPSP